MSVFVRIAVRNLIQARRRTALLALAMMMVTILLVLLLGISRGISDTLMRAATTLSSGHVNIAGFFKAKTTDAAPCVRRTTELRKIAKDAIWELDYMVDRVRGWARVVSETGSLNTGLTGIDIREETRFSELVELAPERDYKEGGRDAAVGDFSRLAKPNQALIFVGQAKRLGVSVDDTIMITVETLAGSRNTTEVTIAGVAKDVGFMSNWSVFLSKATLRDLYRIDEDVTGAIEIHLRDPAKATEVMGRLRPVLESRGFALMDHDPKPFWMKFEAVAAEDWTGQKLDLTIWNDEISFLEWVLAAIDSIALVLISILVVIIAIGIMNSMWISVRERTAEVGTLRAIGMSKRSVLVMFVLEAAILGFASTSVGCIAGTALAEFIDSARIHVPYEAMRAILMSDTLHLVVSSKQLVGAIVLFTSVAALAALWPAHRASRMQPVRAIQNAT